MAELRDTLYEAELSGLVVGLGNGTGETIGQGNAVDIGELPFLGKEGTELHVLAGIVGMAEEEGMRLVASAECLGAVHRGAEVHHRTAPLGQDGRDELLAVGLVFGIGVEGSQAQISCLLVAKAIVGMHQNHFGMLLQQESLFLQLPWVAPFVVARQVGNVLAARLQETVVVVVEEAFVLRIAYQADNVGISGSVVSTDFLRLVGRAIFADDDFDGPDTTLAQDAVERPCDGLLLIVGADNDGYLVFKLQWNSIFAGE